MGATWDEISLAEKVCTIPEERMKNRNEHKVPLSDAAVKILKRMAGKRENDFVFPCASSGGCLGDMVLFRLLRSVGRDDLTTHGFHRTFRDWVAECTEYPREIAEAALAHGNADKVEAAYLRSDFLERRRRLMNDWADFCARPPAKVLQFPGDGKKRRRGAVSQ